MTALHRRLRAVVGRYLPEAAARELVRELAVVVADHALDTLYTAQRLRGAARAALQDHQRHRCSMNNDTDSHNEDAMKTNNQPQTTEALRDAARTKLVALINDAATHADALRRRGDYTDMRTLRNEILPEIKAYTDALAVLNRETSVNT